MTRRGLAVAGLVGGTLGFVGVALAVERGGVASWDERLALDVAARLPTAVEVLARPFSWIGGGLGLVALVSVAALLLARRREWVDLAFLLVATVGVQVVVAGLKAAFDRPRPDVDPVVRLPSSTSFPSGHAASGVAALGALAVVATSRLPRGRTRRLLWASTVAVGCLVGLSRIALGVHFASDVVAGWCVGIAWLSLCLLGRDLLAGATGAEPGSKDRNPRPPDVV